MFLLSYYPFLLFVVYYLLFCLLPPAQRALKSCSAAKLHAPIKANIPNLVLAGFDRKPVNLIQVCGFFRQAGPERLKISG